MGIRVVGGGASSPGGYLSWRMGGRKVCEEEVVEKIIIPSRGRHCGCNELANQVAQNEVYRYEEEVGT